jgi:DNA N-6-adenine-methyltransferase (Dam)
MRRATPGPEQTDLLDYIGFEPRSNLEPKRRPSRTRKPPETADWIVPREIIDALGTFDLDPCAAKVQPWRCADRSFALPDNGLIHIWKGRVWLNPPHGSDTARWVRKMAEHGVGTALLFARTDAAFFGAHVFDRASAVLFLKGRVRFHKPDGSLARRAAGAAAMLVAYGAYDANQLEQSGIAGSFIRITRPEKHHVAKGSKPRRKRKPKAE